MTVELKTINLLIIEDYKLTRVGLRMALNEYDALEVTGEAEDAETGIELIKKLYFIFQEDGCTQNC